MSDRASVDYVKPTRNTETMYRDSGANVAVECAEITPHDTNELEPHARALYVGGTGDVKIVTPRGTVVTFAGVIGGTILPCYVKIVMDTGTDATNIVAFYG